MLNPISIVECNKYDIYELMCQNQSGLEQTAQFGCDSVSCELHCAFHI